MFTFKTNSKIFGAYGSFSLSSWFIAVFSALYWLKSRKNSTRLICKFPPANLNLFVYLWIGVAARRLFIIQTPGLFMKFFHVLITLIKAIFPRRTTVNEARTCISVLNYFELLDQLCMGEAGDLKSICCTEWLQPPKKTFFLVQNNFFFSTFLPAFIVKLVSIHILLVFLSLSPVFTCVF